MEERGTGEKEPAEQTDLLSLIISGEEDPTPGETDLGHSLGGEDGIANGHNEDASEGREGIPISSSSTSYWSITEHPDQPLLLSPAPGPSCRKPRVQRASRPGLSRIPGRDHRRYYHEYWRSEYLMDFDPRRHGMICMVCGSSLATLKLSTIKRHIRQKHPDSLLWSAADKEVIRSGWESHLSLDGAPRPYCSTSGPSLQGDEEPPPSAQHSTELDPGTPQHKSEPPSVSPPPSVEKPSQPDKEELPGPSAEILERYLNDSLHAWFRQEFLMEYEAQAGRLMCMVCGGQLPSLHLDHIKSHVLDTHPNSLVYSSEEKHCILQAWAQAHEESDDLIKSESDTKDAKVNLFPQDAAPDPVDAGLCPDGGGPLTQDTSLLQEDGAVKFPDQPPQPFRSQPRRRRLRGGEPWRLRLDYLVAYGPQGRGTCCMVCSQALSETKVSGFRRHIQECHPETTTLSRQEREAMAAAWTKDYPTQDTPDKEEDNPSEAGTQSAAGGTNDKAPPSAAAPSEPANHEEGVGGGKSKPRETGPSRHSHYPGKDQRRNYQVRWRMEYLMDYDCRRHGLICMVCGATLATLKVSTIKRHIQQVHPHSLEYGPEEKQQALLSYNQTALPFIHSDDCFSSQDHGHAALEPAPGNVGT
ncbi:zinc finger translocation-associated protein isoform X2 [Lampris incognitus]|uniref:zinc finger translocation-associated protein isoform X2 n=1 Tax=Lampris incognitus TaxID=2546036 RepID=UPI0024B4C5E6|nr:zinc finger translocation-associated protein isoform X2 [Lampris incognitus]